LQPLPSFPYFQKGIQALDINAQVFIFRVENTTSQSVTVKKR